MLPQNPQGITNSDRILLEAVNAQTHNLNAQSKVLHTVSERILQQNAEFKKLRKDVQDIGKTFMQGNNSSFAEIKKYFEKNKAQNKQQPKMNASNQKSKGDDDKGFFKGMFSKLFGPSKYQQRMMDDTTALLDMTTAMAKDISFIKKQYEEPNKARDRELLAEAIARRINSNSSEGGLGGGMLAALGASLLTGFAALGTTFIRGFETLGNGIKLLGETLGNLLKVGWGLLTELGAAIAELAAGLWEWLKTGKMPTTIPPEETAKTPTGKLPNGQPRLPNNQPRLPAPSPVERLIDNGKGMFIPESEFSGGSSLMDKIKNIPGVAMSILKRSKGGIAGIAGGLAYNYGMPDEYKQKIADFIQENFDLNNTGEKIPLAEMLGPDKEKMAAAARRKFAQTDPRLIDTRQMDAEQARREFAQTDPRLIKQTEDETSLFNKALQSSIDALFGFERDLEEMASKTLDAVAPWLDKQTELDFGNGQKLNILPGFGTSLAEVLKEVGSETKELIGDAYEGAKDITTNIINNMQKESAANPIAFTPSSASTEAAALSSMNLFKRGIGRIR